MPDGNPQASPGPEAISESSVQSGSTQEPSGFGTVILVLLIAIAIRVICKNKRPLLRVAARVGPCQEAARRMLMAMPQQLNTFDEEGTEAMDPADGPGDSDTDDRPKKRAAKHSESRRDKSSTKKRIQESASSEEEAEPDAAEESEDGEYEAREERSRRRSERQSGTSSGTSKKRRDERHQFPEETEDAPSEVEGSTFEQHVEQTRSHGSSKASASSRKSSKGKPEEPCVVGLQDRLASLELQLARAGVPIAIEQAVVSSQGEFIPQQPKLTHKQPVKAAGEEDDSMTMVGLPTQQLMSQQASVSTKEDEERKQQQLEKIMRRKVEQAAKKAAEEHKGLKLAAKRDLTKELEQIDKQIDVLTSNPVDSMGAWANCAAARWLIEHAYSKYPPPSLSKRRVLEEINAARDLRFREQTINALKLLQVRYAAEKNSPDHVGAKRAVIAEEICKHAFDLASGVIKKKSSHSIFTRSQKDDDNATMLVQKSASVDAEEEDSNDDDDDEGEEDSDVEDAD